MIEVCSLSSGSNGNAFFIRTGADCFLVDAGISCKQICLRLQQINSHIEEIKAVFITHEHSDHIRGLRVLLNRFSIPVYISEKTYHRLPEKINEGNIEIFNSHKAKEINQTEIHSFPKSHDAVDPSFFSFIYKGRKISIITDFGYACANVIQAVRDSHILFLESNYDENMLWNGPYPYYLKQRVHGQYGHLSNACAGDLIVNHASQNLTHVFLSHLSENNNTPDIALHSFSTAIKKRPDLKDLKTILSPRSRISSLIRLKFKPN